MSKKKTRRNFLKQKFSKKFLWKFMNFSSIENLFMSFELKFKSYVCWSVATQSSWCPDSIFK